MTDPFKTIEMLARERNEMSHTLTRTRERLSRFIEVARCAKRLLELNEAAAQEGDGTIARNSTEQEFATFMAKLAVEVQRLEFGPEGATMLTPPASMSQSPTGVVGYGGRHIGDPDCPMTYPNRSPVSNCTCPQVPR